MSLKLMPNVSIVVGIKEQAMVMKVWGVVLSVGICGKVYLRVRTLSYGSGQDSTSAKEVIGITFWGMTDACCRDVCSSVNWWIFTLLIFNTSVVFPDETRLHVRENSEGFRDDSLTDTTVKALPQKR